MNIFRLSSLCALTLGLTAASVALTGCGGEDGGSTPSRVRVQAYALDSTPTGSWRSVRLKVQWPGDTREACEPYEPGMGLDLPEVPFDAEFSVIVRFYSTADCTGEVLAVGRSTPRSIPRTAIDEQLVYVPIGPVSQFVRTSRVVPDTATGAITTQPSEPVAPRFGASVTPLPDGRVVVIGGARMKDPSGDGIFDNSGDASRPWELLDNIEEVYDTVEIYDSATGAWEALDTAPASPQTLFYPRVFHKTVYIPSVNLLAIVGGYQKLQGSPPEQSPYIELFDPVTKQFAAADSVGALSRPRVGHSVDVLSYGQGSAAVNYLIVAGGKGTSKSSYEVLSLEKTNNIAANDTFPNGRWGHQTAMTTGPDGKRRLFFVGGEDESGPTPVIDIYLVDDKTPIFLQIAGAAAPSGMAHGRTGHQVVYVPEETPTLPEGLYVLGGYTNQEHTSIANRIEVFNTGDSGRAIGESLVESSQNFNLNLPRALHAATLLNTGHILVTGGLTYDTDKLKMVAGNEVVGPVPVSGGSVEIRAAQTSSLITNRFFHHAVGLPNGQGLVVGGLIKLDGYVRMLGAVQVDQGSEIITFD